MDSNIRAFPKSTVLIASEWVAKLDRDQLTSHESQQLTKWLKSDPINREVLAAQLQQWSDMNVLSELTHFDLTAESSSFLDRSKNSFQVFQQKFSLAQVLTVCALVVAISWFGFNQFGNDDLELELTINTLVGEQLTESMPDGSVIHFNTISSAHIAYSRDKRSVVLNSGEAFFDVAPEKDRPFVVYAADTSIRAIGTAFAVYNDKGSISVSVTEGAVEFISSGITKIIAANDKSENLQTSKAEGNVATYNDDGVSVDTQPAEEVARKLSWQDGMLEFRGEPLEYVVQQLGRYTDAQIVIVDNEIKDLRLGGYFKIGDIDGLASTLALGFNIKVDVISDDLIQLSRNQTN